MKITYRPEIDGLRGIAVIAVILYHAQINIFDHNFFKGGFLGVDIFFVISGYLITSLILKELVTTGKFSFLHFYERRARRILPILLVVILASLPFAMIYLLPGSLEQFSQSILYQLGFNSNFYFWSYYHFSYAAESALTLPLLHTWSLSVEEQFYFLFPICFFIVFKFFKKYLIHIIILTIITTLIFAHWASIRYPSFTFYMLPFRIWELLAGSVLSILEIFFKKRRLSFNNDLLNKIFSITGLIILISYIVFFDSSLPHPSINTFFLILGVCLIIWFSSKNELITKLLSSKPLVGIGLISYSFYLWHYPIFAYARYLQLNDFENNILLKLSLILISFLISIFTFLFIEKKFRNPQFNFSKCMYFFIISIFLIISFSVITIKNEGYVKRLNLSKFQKEFVMPDDYNDDLLINIVKTKYSDLTSPKKKILIIGNSHGEDFFKILVSNSIIKKKYDINYFFSQIHCLENTLKIGKNLCGRTFNINKEKTRLGIANIKIADIIIFRTRWNKADLDQIENLVSFFKKLNKKIIIISDTPEFDNTKENIKSNNFYSKKIIQKIFYKKNLPLERFVLDNDRVPSKNELNKLEKEYFLSIKPKMTVNNNFLEKKSKELDIKYLDYFNVICNKIQRTCDILTDDLMSIHDDTVGHVSNAGNKYIGKKIYELNWLNIN